MRRSRLVKVAFGFLASGLALQAQHGGPVGAMSSPHFGAAPPSFAPPPRSKSPIPAVHSPVLPTGRPGHTPSDRTPHHPGNSGAGSRERYPSVYAGYPWLIPFGYGLPLAGGVGSGDEQDEVSSPQPPPQESAGPQAIDYGQPAELAAYGASPFRPAYQGPVVTAPVREQPATTLIFKDGRPSAQVHNYALTADTLYAFEGDSRQEIPLSLLNVPATVAVNRAAGVDFAVPGSR